MRAWKWSQGTGRTVLETDGGIVRGLVMTETTGGTFKAKIQLSNPAANLNGGERYTWHTAARGQPTPEAARILCEAYLSKMARG